MIMFSTGLKYWFSRYLLVFGGCWLFFEPAGLFFVKLQGLGWYGFFGINVLSLVLTAWVFHPKKSISIVLPESNTRISIAISDILEQKGSIVIGTSDTFDTELGEIINANSLQGQLLTKVYQSDKNTLDLDINNALKDVIAVVDSTKSYGKKERYPIGTVASVQRNNNRYFLLAFNKMLSNKKQVTTDIGEFWASLSQCWDSIRGNGHHGDVHVPIIGTKFARTGLPQNIVVQLIIMSFMISTRREEVAPSLTVHVHKKDIDNIDFVALKGWLDCLAGKT